MSEFTELAVKLAEACREFRIAGFSQKEALLLTQTMLVELMKPALQQQGSS